MLRKSAKSVANVIRHSFVLCCNNLMASKTYIITNSYYNIECYLPFDALAVTSVLFRGCSGGKSTNNWLLKLAASRTALATPSSTLASLEAAKGVSILALEVDEVTGEVGELLEVGVDLFRLLLRLFFGLWSLRTFLPISRRKKRTTLSKNVARKFFNVARKKAYQEVLKVQWLLDEPGRHQDCQWCLVHVGWFDDVFSDDCEPKESFFRRL